MKKIQMKLPGVPSKEVEVANTFWTRFLGLMGRDSLNRNTGLLIEPCNEIHMFFMKFPIDVVGLRKFHGAYVVTDVVRHVKPWRILPRFTEAQSVLELPAGEADLLLVGDLIPIKEVI